MSDRPLTPKQLEERGLAGMFGPSPTQEVLSKVPIMGENFRSAPLSGEYIPENDVTETLPDGRTIQVAVKGVAIPMADAVRAGLIKESKQSGPSKTKPAPAPEETKPKAGPKESK